MPTYSVAHFVARGVTFAYVATSPGVPQVTGPLGDPALLTQFREAVASRRGLPMLAKRHAGDCNQNGRSQKGVFCTLCRRVQRVCIFCGDPTFSGELDCALCRLATVKGMREKGISL